MGWMARSGTKARLAWVWWRQHRRWRCLTRVQPHWITLRPMAPTVTMTGKRWILMMLMIVGLGHGNVGRTAGALMLGVLIWRMLNRWQRWRYKPLLKELEQHGRAWHQLRLEAWAAADLDRWRFQASRWWGPVPTPAHAPSSRVKRSG